MRKLVAAIFLAAIFCGFNVAHANAAFVQAATPTSTAQTSATTVATASITQTAGNLLIYIAYYDGSGAGGTEPTITPSDTRGDTFVKIQSVWDATNLLKAEWGYAKNVAGGTNALTITYGGTTASTYFKGVALYEYSGLSTTAPFIIGESNGQEQASVGTTANSLVSGNTAALTAQPALIVGFSSIAHNTNGAPTIGTSPLAFSANSGTFWDFATGINFSQVESIRVTSTGAFQATFNPLANANFFTFVAAFHEPGGGGGAVQPRLPLTGVGARMTPLTKSAAAPAG